ncbi:unnamed protein product, partial [Ectocarpus fasciculatus]
RSLAEVCLQNTCAQSGWPPSRSLPKFRFATMPGVEDEGKASGRKASDRNNTSPRFEEKKDGSEYAASEEDLAETSIGDDPRELELSEEEDAAEADINILDQLDQDLSRAEELEWLLEDAKNTVQHLNRIVAEGQNDRRARKEAEKVIKQLQEEGESARLTAERALEAARDARVLAIQEAHRRVEKVENANAQILLEAQEEMERAVAARANDQPERDLSKRKMDELLNEVRSMKDRIKGAIQDAAQARNETAPAHHEAPQARQEAAEARQENTRTLPGAAQAVQETTDGRQTTEQVPQDTTPTRGEAAEVAAQVPVRGGGSTSRHVAPNSATAVKWVEAEGEGGPLSANKEAGEVLKGVPSNQVVNVLTILG